MKCWSDEINPIDATEIVVADDECTIGDNAILDLSKYKRLRSISIGDNSFPNVVTLNLTGLNELTSISIGDNSFPNVVTLNLTGLNELMSISIGDESFSNVNELHIDGLNGLENLTIGMNSFTKNKNSYGSGTDGSYNYDGKPANAYSSYMNRKFYLRNCPLLKEVRIGRYSFSDYMYSYIENLDSLELLQFGDVAETSYNFYIAEYASFESDRMNND